MRERLDSLERPFVLATDLDDTLLRDGAIDGGLEESVLRFVAAGGEFVPLTARPVALVHDVLHDHLLGHLVASNGAYVRTGGRVHYNALDSDDIDFALHHARAAGLPIAVESAETIFADGTMLPVVASEHPDARDITDAAPDTPLLKIILDVRRADLDQVTDELGRRFATQVMAGGRRLELLGRGVSKGSALQDVLRSLGLSRWSVVGVGDAPNDLSFLTLAGLSVAVRESSPSVARMADLQLHDAYPADLQRLVGAMTELIRGDAA